jgi:hypothetical protein
MTFICQHNLVISISGWFPDVRQVKSLVAQALGWDTPH